MSSQNNNIIIEQYLDDASNEYRDLLYSALLARSQSECCLNISDLVELDHKAKLPLFSEYYKRERLSKTFFIIGLCYALIGIFVFIYSEIKVMPTINNFNVYTLALSSILVLFGVFTCLFSYIYPKARLSKRQTKQSLKDSERALLEYRVIATWRTIEGIARDISINSKLQSPYSVISFLYSNKFISEIEANTLKSFLKLRNDIVHSSKNKHSLDEINQAIINVNKIISDLKVFL